MSAASTRFDWAMRFTITRTRCRPHPIAIIVVIQIWSLLCCPSAARSAALGWVGGTSSDWGTASNWSPAQVPTALDSCTVNSYTTNQPTLSSAADCGSLILGTGGTSITLTISGNQALNIAGDVTIGANGRIAPSGVPTNTFTIGGNWLDDPGTANFINPANLRLSFQFTGSSKTISTNERFFRVQIGGSITLNSNITIDDTLTISNTNSLTQGANTIVLNGAGLNINGTYNHTCGSTLVINGNPVNMTGGIHYPNIIINNGGWLEGANAAVIDCDLTNNAGGTFRIAANVSVGGNWINNGGTFICNSGNVQFTGVGKEITGTAALSWFHHVTFGDGAGDSMTVRTHLEVAANLTVTAGATLTLAPNKNITLTGASATISGNMYVSGTTTWTQVGGNNIGIFVTSTGFLSVQGTDVANRVTFTRTGLNYYAFLIDGGMDVNNADVYYTQSAEQANTGFQIRTPGAATLAFNNVSFNFTENVTSAAIMKYDSPKTIVASGIRFDSSTYTPGSDVNVEARAGVITFTNFGGNYAGEALDFDNGGSATWDLTLVKQVWQAGGSTPLATTNGAPVATTVPVGATVVFLIYVKNTDPSAAADVRFSDLLDVSASGFSYVPGSAIRTSAGAPPADTASDLTIFNATAPGTGTAQTDAVDGDVASRLNISATQDRITVGNTTGLIPAQVNGVLSIAANTTFAIRFQATKQ